VTAIYNNNIPGQSPINNVNDLYTSSGGDAADIATGIPGPEVTINTTNDFSIFLGGDSADNATALHNNNIPGPESDISPAATANDTVNSAATILNATHDSSSFSC
jgi:hypothetical protein